VSDNRATLPWTAAWWCARRRATAWARNGVGAQRRGRATAWARNGVGRHTSGLYAPRMLPLAEAVDVTAYEHGFAGVVCVDRGGEVMFAKAYGLADRAHRIPNTVDTRFAIASGSKGLTALTVVSLIEDGALRLSTTARSVLGTDLPLIGDDVTVEHLLAHRSGIGDYLDEEADHEITDYVLTVPVHELATTEGYLAVLDGHRAKFAPDERFSYCNGGYVVLALIAERVSGAPFHELVRQRVCAPAGMRDTEFLRSDELPARTAVGYLPIEGRSRTNVLHLPVRGSGDGGIYSTVADVSSFWRSLFAGAIVSSGWVAQMVRPRSALPSGSMRYGLGFWLYPSTDTVMLEGCDAGVSFRTVHDPGSTVTHTVISNSSDGAWPITRRVGELLAD
jgi:CubicO group peptidase (beta-lactamase class C family)